jgi:uncharacterized protein
MENTVRIPMFPLAILPIPGELVPLHIFEPRYRQLLIDLESSDVAFGIYCSHEINTLKVGSLMRLESVIKRYPGGESDIVVKCLDNFTLDKLFRTYQEKPYPAGDVSFWNTDISVSPGLPLHEIFMAYLQARNITQQPSKFSLYQVANELPLEISERYKFLFSSPQQKRFLLTNRIRFLMHLLRQEDISKDIFHLN